jgi:hypothetical protein
VGCCKRFLLLKGNQKQRSAGANQTGRVVVASIGLILDQPEQRRSGMFLESEILNVQGVPIILTAHFENVWETRDSS